MKHAPLRAFWWRWDPTRQPPMGNFGDEITPLLIEAIFGRRCEWSPPERCELVGAGSIIELLVNSRGTNRPAIWGSGFISSSDGADWTTGALPRDRFEVAALRGRLSMKQACADDGVALGDPGLLASALVRPGRIKKHLLGVIPHFVDSALPEIDDLRNQPGVTIIGTINDPITVVNRVAECQFVASSSLHGLVVADSLGVPNIHFRLSSCASIGGMHKFTDYYSAFSEGAYRKVLERRQLNSLDAEQIVEFISNNYVTPPNLDALQKRIIAAFPF